MATVEVDVIEITVRSANDHLVDRKALDDVKVIVTHADCADGMASALILANVYPSAEVLFLQYNTPALRDLVARPGMLFCDMTPPLERTFEFRDAGAIVLDHHAGAEAVVAAFGDRGVYADLKREPGVSGAVLAYREVWLSRCPDLAVSADVATLAKFAGIYDTWQTKNPWWQSARALSAALRFWPFEELSGRGWSVILERLMIGSTLLAKDAARDVQSIAGAYRFTYAGVRVVVFEGLHTNDIAETLKDEADLVMGWSYRVVESKPMIKVSCRARGDFSEMALAKRYGGNGHDKAAGFQVGAVTSASPYAQLEEMVAMHLHLSAGT